ncbi:MAG: hypothetical protein ABIG35_13885 [Pseudomonadota bacterium]
MSADRKAHQAAVGHDLPVKVTFQFLLVVHPEIELSDRYSAGRLMTPRQLEVMTDDK